jgi:hypothetical protein
VELLDDKNNALREILKKNKEDAIKQISKANLKCNSICMDNLCKLSMLKQEKEFLNKLEEFMNFFKNKENMIFILPFFDENYIQHESEFIQILKILSK